MDVNKENSIARFKEEVAHLQACLAEQEKQHLLLLAKVSPPVRPSGLVEVYSSRKRYVDRSLTLFHTTEVPSPIINVTRVCVTGMIKMVLKCVAQSKGSSVGHAVAECVDPGPSKYPV